MIYFTSTQDTISSLRIVSLQKQFLHVLKAQQIEVEKTCESAKAAKSWQPWRFRESSAQSGLAGEITECSESSSSSIFWSYVWKADDK